MKYPAIPESKRRNRKLTEEQIKHIQTSGKTAWQLSKEMGITYKTARRYLDPEFRKKYNAYMGNIVKEKYRNDKKFRQNSNDNRAKNQKVNRSLYPKLAEYNRANAEKRREEAN